MISLRQFTTRPCPVCAKDTTFIGMNCHECGTPMTLSERPSWAFDPAVTTKARKEKHRERTRLKDRERSRRYRALKKMQAAKGLA